MRAAAAAATDDAPPASAGGGLLHAASLPPLPRPTTAAGPRLVVFSGGTAFNTVAGEEGE